MGSKEKQVHRGGRVLSGGVTELAGNCPAEFRFRSNTERTVVSSKNPLQRMGERDTSGAEEDTNFSMIDVLELYGTELGIILINIIEFGGIGGGKVDIRGGKSVLYVKFLVIVGVRWMSNNVAETDKEGDRLRNCTSSLYSLPVFKLRKLEIWLTMYVPVLPGSIKAYVSNVLSPLMMETGII